MSLCVYALTTRQRPPARLGVRGIAGERLRLIDAAGVAAVVGNVPRPPRVTIEQARRYDQVLRALLDRLPAVLPVRFGTCVDDADQLGDVLGARGKALRQAVRHVRGRVQMSIAILGGSAWRDEGPVRERKSGGRGPGQRFLQARAEALARERHVPGFEPARAALTRWVHDERVVRRTRGKQLAVVHHLIPARSAARYRRAAEEAAAAAGFDVTVTGPLPPYAFAGEGA